MHASCFMLLSTLPRGHAACRVPACACRSYHPSNRWVTPFQRALRAVRASVTCSAGDCAVQLAGRLGDEPHLQLSPPSPCCSWEEGDKRTALGVLFVGVGAAHMHLWSSTAHRPARAVPKDEVMQFYWMPCYSILLLLKSALH
ncbi:hypothetical protein VPH35_051701 [Triticum aestivum]